MSVEVKLELGHRASLRDKPTPEGFTHDWTVFVRGAEGSNIQYFVEKVVFYLHESFPKPKRVVKDPPYSVSESGYAGFIMPIEVHFRTKEEPKKVRFEYDLYLRLECPPVNNIRLEKLTFQNPSDDFRCKLLRAGGSILKVVTNTVQVGALTGSASGAASLQTQPCAPPQIVEDHNSNHSRQGFAEKKPRSHFATKEPKPVSTASLLPPPPPPPPLLQSQPTAPKPSQPFTDIFGAPIRTKSSPDTTVKSKDTGHSSSQTKSKILSSSTTSSNKESKSKEHHKSSHHLTKEAHHTAKENHSSKEVHHTLKEHHVSKEVHHSSKETHHKESHHSSKESHHHSNKETHHHVKEVHHKGSHLSKEAQHSKDHHSSKEGHRVKEHSSKDTHSSLKEAHYSESKDIKATKLIKAPKDSKSSAVTFKKPFSNNSLSSHGIPEKKKKHISTPTENTERVNDCTKTKVKESKEKTEKHKIKSFNASIKEEKEKSKYKSIPVPVENREIMKPKLSSPVQKHVSPISSEMDSDSDESVKNCAVKAQYSSSASSISSASLDGSNPFSNVISDIENNVLSPLTSDEELSPPRPVKRKFSSDSDSDIPSPEPPKQEPEPILPPPKLESKHHSHHKSTKHKSSKHHKGNGNVGNDVRTHYSLSKENLCSDNARYHEELIELQRIIMSSNDRQVLQKVVDIIEKTGKYEVSNTSFDFDLCTLDYSTIKKLKLYLTNL